MLEYPPRAPGHPNAPGHPHAPNHPHASGHPHALGHPHSPGHAHAPGHLSRSRTDGNSPPTSLSALPPPGHNHSNANSSGGEESSIHLVAEKVVVGLPEDPVEKEKEKRKEGQKEPAEEKGENHLITASVGTLFKSSDQNHQQQQQGYLLTSTPTSSTKNSAQNHPSFYRQHHPPLHSQHHLPTANNQHTYHQYYHHSKAPTTTTTETLSSFLVDQDSKKAKKKDGSQRSSSSYFSVNSSSAENENKKHKNLEENGVDCPTPRLRHTNKTNNYPYYYPQNHHHSISRHYHHQQQNDDEEDLLDPASSETIPFLSAASNLSIDDKDEDGRDQRRMEPSAILLSSAAVKKVKKNPTASIFNKFPTIVNHPTNYNNKNDDCRRNPFALIGTSHTLHSFMTSTSAAAANSSSSSGAVINKFRGGTSGSMSSSSGVGDRGFSFNSTTMATNRFVATNNKNLTNSHHSAQIQQQHHQPVVSTTNCVNYDVDDDNDHVGDEGRRQRSRSTEKFPEDQRSLIFTSANTTAHQRTSGIPLIDHQQSELHSQQPQLTETTINIIPNGAPQQLTTLSSPLNHHHHQQEDNIVNNDQESFLSQNIPGILVQMRPIYIILMLFGNYPSLFKIITFPRTLSGRVIKILCKLGIVTYSLCVSCFSLYFFSQTITTTSMYHTMFDLLHAQTISSIILGLKPLINGIVVLIFMMNLSRHHKFMQQLEHIHRLYLNEFGCQPNMKNHNLFVMLTSLATFLMFFSLRVTEHVFLREAGLESLGVDWMSDISFVVVPMLTTVAVVPLLYFEVCNRLMRFWSKALRMSIRKDIGKRPIKFYYTMFLEITKTQDMMGKAFNPFILFSLGWSVFSLCLTIYFITQSEAHFAPPPVTLPPEHRPSDHQWLLIVLFNQAYGGVQVLLAIVYISILCFTGTSTNEKVRSARATESVTCFIYKINTQYMWGVTVWRAFPLERGAFFTIVSMILTYAFLLLKFKQSHPDWAENERLNSTAQTPPG